MRRFDDEAIMIDLVTRRATFRKLHEQGCFLLPNPWDRGSAIILEQLGFKALATSSAGFAFSRGLPDTATALGRDMVLDHIRDLASATELPLNADFQSGYADDPEGVATSVRLCVEAGVAGLSIEDATGDVEAPLFEMSVAVERIRAAWAVIDELGVDVMLTARAECHLVGHPQPLEESVRRLQAYAEAGADVLFAPGLRDREAIRTVIRAVAPKPVNVLVAGNIGLRVSDIAALGARRISVGSALARVAWTAFMKSARAIIEEGQFESFEAIASTRDMSDWFMRD